MYQDTDILNSDTCLCPIFSYQPKTEALQPARRKCWAERQLKSLGSLNVSLNNKDTVCAYKP